MPAAGRGRGRGRGRRASTESSEMDWEDTSSESTEEDEEYEGPFDNAEDEVDEVCCPLCGEVFRHDDDMPPDTRLPLKYLVTSHILAAHPEDENIIEPPSENNSSAFRDSASPNYSKAQGTDTQTSLVPDSGDSLEVPNEAAGTENTEDVPVAQPPVSDVPPLEDETAKESLEEAKQNAKEKREAAKKLKEEAEQAEARGKLITEKKIFVPTSLDDEDSEKTIVEDDPMPAPSLPAPPSASASASASAEHSLPPPEAVLSYSQTVSQLMPEHYPALEEPTQQRSDITITVKGHGDPQVFTVSKDTKVSDFVQQISESKGVTCNATLVCGRELQGDRTLCEEGITDGVSVRYVVLAKPAKPAPKPKAPKKESGEAPKRKRNSEEEADAKKQKVDDEHPAETQAKTSKIRAEVVKRLCARIVSESGAQIEASQPIAAELEKVIWELHGAVRCGPYRSHIRRLFAMGKDVAVALADGSLSPQGASKKTE